MPAADALLIADVTTSTAREFVASQVNGQARIILPCAGRLAVAAEASRKTSPSRIWASDIALFPSILGYLADPRHALADLGITVPAELHRFTDGAATEFDQAAGIILAVKFASMKPATAYVLAQRDELWKAGPAAHRDRLAAALATMTEMVSGIHYQIADPAGVTAGLAADPDSALWFCNAYKAAHTRPLDDAEDLFWDCPVPRPAYTREWMKGIITALDDSPALALAYTVGDDLIPPGWTRLLAVTSGQRTDYVSANHDTGARAIRKKRPVADPHPWTVYADQEITPQSVITFVNTDQPTVLHYRDLFVHKLGTPKAEQYCLMLVDGRVVTAFGIHLRDLVLGKMEHIEEVFGISVTSDRYARLGKLFMMALTSGQFKTWIMHQSRMLHRFDPPGIQTPSPTKLHEGKTDRGVMKLVRREPRPGGGFQLLYQGDFRDDTFADVVRSWCEQYAWIARPEWDGPRLEQPHQAQRTRRRKGRST